MEPSIKRPQIRRLSENQISADPNSNQFNPCYGFFMGVLPDGIRTAGGLTPDPLSLRAKRPVRVNAIRFSESEVSLPIHPFLAETEVETVIAACNNWSE